MLTKKTLESKRETAGAILAEQSRAAVEMSDSHSESLPKATIWSLKLHCMDNLLLCTRKENVLENLVERQNSYFHSLAFEKYIFLSLAKWMTLVCFYLVFFRF